MPEMRYFIVQQIREVKVRANSAVGAAQIADAKFNGNAPLTMFEGSTTSEVRDIDLIVREDR